MQVRLKFIPSHRKFLLFDHAPVIVTRVYPILNTRRALIDQVVVLLAPLDIVMSLALELLAFRPPLPIQRVLHIFPLAENRWPVGFTLGQLAQLRVDPSGVAEALTVLLTRGPLFHVLKFPVSFFNDLTWNHFP